jgi:hypothetical protein
MTTRQQLALHDKQIASIRALMKGGIEMVAEIRRLTLDTRRDLRAVAAAQKRTEKNIADLIAALGRSQNGHT